MQEVQLSTNPEHAVQVELQSWQILNIEFGMVMLTGQFNEHCWLYRKYGAEQEEQTDPLLQSKQPIGQT